MDWNKRLDEFRAEHGLRSDAALARLLGFTPQFISDVRKGRPFSPKLKFKLLERPGIEWSRENLLLLLDNEVAAMVVQSENGSGRTPPKIAFPVKVAAEGLSSP